MSTNPNHKRFPFRVPEGYFGQSADDMTAAFMADRPAGFSWQAVASVLMLISVGAWLLFAPASEGESDCVTFACLLEQTETHELEQELNDLLLEDSWGSFSEDWVDLPADDILF